MRKSILALAGLALIASASFASLATVNGADHRDSPSVTSDTAADNTDIYAFRNGDNLVVVTGFFPLTAPSDNTRIGLDTSVQFQLEIDRTGDLRPDLTPLFRFSGNNLIIEGLGDTVTAPITPLAQANAVVTQAGPVKVFAGLRDDPFFFDLAGFQTFVANPRAPASGLRPAGGGTASDTFAGTNVFAVVVELPIVAITGGARADEGMIKVVGNINRGNSPVDRVAIPAVNTALIPPTLKNDFNQNRDETQDVAKFKPAMMSTIEMLRRAADGLFNTPQDGGPLGNLTADQLSSALLPYVVTIDFSKPVQFPNGRRLQDDVIDVALGLTLNRGGARGISDGVSANDVPLLGSFPYLAPPHQAAGGAAPPSATAAPGPIVRAPSTGDGGLLNDSSSMWTLSAASFLAALGLGGTGAYVALRNRSR